MTEMNVSVTVAMSKTLEEMSKTVEEMSETVENSICPKKSLRAEIFIHNSTWITSEDIWNNVKSPLELEKVKWHLIIHSLFALQNHTA